MLLLLWRSSCSAWYLDATSCCRPHTSQPGASPGVMLFDIFHAAGAKQC